MITTCKLIDYEMYFIHIPKNGGTSFQKQFIKNDVGHYNITKLPENIWHKTIAIIRNPFTRLISLYNYAKMKKSYWHSIDKSTKYDTHDLFTYCNNNTFTDFIKDISINKELFNHIHIRPQYTWIITPNGDIVSKIIKLENVDEELSNLLKINVKLMKINESTDNKYRNYFNEETEEIVRNLYRKDFELFGPFELP